MRLNRQRGWLLILIALGFLVSLALLVMLGPWATSEPAYQDKLVSTWFMEYAFSSNPPVAGAILSLSTSPDGRMVARKQTAAGNIVTLVAHD